MDADSQRLSQNARLSTDHEHLNDGSVVDHSNQTVACTLCRKILSPDNETAPDLGTVNLCGDCKFLVLEDLGTPTQDSHRRRPARGRRTRYTSSESTEILFSQQFSHMINLVRQNQSTLLVHEDQPVDGNTTATLLQHSSSRITTPSGSRRWQTVLSDTESDGFDNLDSLYGESESNFSFGRYRLYQGESDAISFSGYGEDSDASVDGRSILDTDMFIQPGHGSYVNSDTDIDPMHAGIEQWDSDDLEDEEGEDEDGQWEEADAEEDTHESTTARSQVQDIFDPSPSESNRPVNWDRRFDSPDFEGAIRWSIWEGRETITRNIFASLDEPDLAAYVGNSGDYLDARGFEELLDHLSETDTFRRGAPPASVSFVNSLPRVTVKEEHDKRDNLACAICKDVLTVGTEANQLPCLHIYHRCCILPWLSARNSCPLCRYELPTDDRDYEEGKQNSGGRMGGIRDIRQQDASEDDASDVSVEVETDETIVEFDRVEGSREVRELQVVDSIGNRSRREGGRGRWFIFAAAPIVSLVGIVLVLWLGNPPGGGSPCNLPEHQIRVPNPGSFPTTTSQRVSRNRRWWSLF